ncbi:LamG domain-containing protein [Paractinoplanes lichenicola]|uniref:LamG domain-containing protein n=1 Tax=Paractinoplanes lichenicola TaxID=2802976 RepID=A0ABS1VJH7_9ACTN|nr:LamG domain-containing protein [Actinoplanes lichenicola]MBL7253902.1 LamG domain-containing protein [Actinoplanes lichenicola]
MKRSSILPALTIFGLLAGISVASPAAAEPPAPTPAPAAADDTGSVEGALTEARRTRKPVEATGATTATSKSTANPDGTVTLEQSAVPARKRVGDTWRELDATLARNADGTWSPKVALTPLRLSGGGTGPMATVGDASVNAAFTAPVTLPEPAVDGATATYGAVLPGVDLQVTALATGGFAEVFVVRDAAAAKNPALAELSFGTRTKGLTLEADAHGNLVGNDRWGSPVLTAPAPMMWDSAPPAKAAAGARATTSTTRGPGSSARKARLAAAVKPGKITLTPDKSLLTGAATRYPVYLDPTFAWSPAAGARYGWATLPADFPQTKYWNSTPDPRGRMQVGNSGEIKSRTFINYVLPIATLRDADINTATFKITQTWAYSCTPTRVNLHAPTPVLTQANAFWNAWVNNLGSVVAYATVANGYNSSCPADGVPFNVKPAIEAAVAANKTVQTFALAAASESDTNGWKEFLQTSPTLAITYNHQPNKPTGMKTSPATSCGATSPTIVGQTDVTLYAPVSDRNKNALGVEFKLWKQGASGTVLARSNPDLLWYSSGSTAVLKIPMKTLKAAAGTSIATFEWNVRATDYKAWSDPSATCRFKFDASRPGNPIIAMPEGVTPQIAVPLTIGIKPPVDENGKVVTPVPTSYLYQLNGGPYATVAATNGTAEIKNLKPTRFTNTLSVTSLSAGGNVGAATQEIFNADPAAVAADGDLTGDNLADLTVVGGKNKLPAGVWTSTGRGTGQIAPIAANLGAHGAGQNDVPADFNTADVITGHFGGTGLQDLLAFYPTGVVGRSDSKGTAVILRGNGDGSVIQSELDSNSQTIEPIFLNEDPEGSSLLQLVNAGAHTAEWLGPDLLGVLQDPDGYRLTYHPALGATGQFNQSAKLSQLTPTGGTDWNTWTLTSAQTTTGTALFLWQATTGKLYLWNDVLWAGGTGLTFDQYLLSENFKTGQKQTLRAADFNGDGTADLWTVNENGEVTGSLVGNLNGGTGSLSAQPWQVFTPPTHTWKLDDAETGAIGAAGAKDTSGTLHASGGGGTEWASGDLFDPAAEFPGTAGTVISTSAKAVTTNADFSVSVWAKPDAYEGIVVSQDGVNGTGFKVWPSAIDNSWRFGMQRADEPYAGATWDIAVSAPNTAKLGVWTHLTVTYKASTKKMTLYVDEKRISSTTRTTTPWSAAKSFRIGDTQKSAGTHGDSFKGQISQVQTWDTVIWPIAEFQDALWDRVRGTDGAWSKTPSMIDSNPAITTSAITRTPDGVVHVFNMVAGSGVWYRTRSASGVWQGDAVQIDFSTQITDLAAAALPDGTIQLQTLLPAYGVYNRTRSAEGVWSAATNFDASTQISRIASTATPDGRTHVLTLLPGYGVYSRSRSAAGTWGPYTRFDQQGNLTDVAAVGMPDNTVHSVTVYPGFGVYDRTMSSTDVWGQYTLLDNNGGPTSVSAAGGADGSMVIDTAGAGTTVTHRVRTAAGTWESAQSSFTTAAKPTNLVSWLTKDGRAHVAYLPDLP